MSKLLDTIKADQLEARKLGDTLRAKLLTTLLGEASPSGNDTTTDDKVQAVVKKFIKNLDEMLKYSKSDSEHFSTLNEIEILNKYMPKQLSEEELDDIVCDLIDDGCDNIGKIMKELNTKYKGQFDGKVASGLARYRLDTLKIIRSNPEAS